ncbi:MAG TPA: NF038122 family metalloprotease [Caulobacteraceae bacterium]
MITPIFDKTITSLSNASTVEGAIDQAVSVFDHDFTSNVNIKIDFSWGTIDGQKVVSSDVSESLSYIYTGFSYANVLSNLQAAVAANPTDSVLVSAVARLTTADPFTLNSFSITEAEAQALGLTPPTGMGTDGYVGFNPSDVFSFNPNSTPSGEYDFVALAEHEIAEVMGRLSGLSSSNPAYAMPYDLFRYSAAGKPSFSYSSPAYFSVNGGLTNLGSFNDTGGGDRGDWLTTSGATDAFDATATKSGNMSLSSADITALNALGWDTTNNPGGWVTTDVASTNGVSLAGDVVPEPETWLLMILGAGFAGATLRRRMLSGAQGL